MLPDRVSNPGPLTYESSELPIALRKMKKSRASLLHETCTRSVVHSREVERRTFSMENTLGSV